MTHRLWLVQLSLGLPVILALVGCGNVQVRPDEPIGTARLKPTHEDKHAGLVGIASGFDPKTYRTIVVERFTVTDKDLSDDDDKQLAQVMPVYLQTKLVERLRTSGLFERVVTPNDAAASSDTGKALRLRGEITQLTGGSRALRFWIGLGAGRSKVPIEARLVDAESSAVVMATADRRVGVMSEAMSLDYGGNSQELTEQTFSDMARDFANFLVRLSQGQAPSSN
jgi:hypothetical protein